MSVKIGHASIAENGTINGELGDQTGKEVCISTLSSKFKYSVVLRPLNSDLAERSAHICEIGCANDSFGYTQGKRNTAHTESRKVGYDLSKVTKPCGTDCSAWMTLCAIASGVNELEYPDSGNAPTTSTMVNAFTATGKYEKLTDSKYIDSDEYLQRGDILVKPGSHTVMILENGSKVKPKKKTIVQKIQDKVKSLYPMRGVDVSKCQQNLDYQKMKDAGVEFAIIKVTNKKNQPEESFEKHYKGFTSVGVPVQYYHYTYAQTVEAANIAAMAIIKTLGDRKGTVWLDLEDKAIQGLGDRLPQIINAYQEKLEAAGMIFGLYSGLSFINPYLKQYISQLHCNKVWMARYYNGYNPMYIDSPLDESKMPVVSGLETVGWQYTSSGVIDGSPNRIDMSIMYKPIGKKSQFFDKISSLLDIRVGYITANSLRVRNQPSLDGNIIGYVTNGTKVLIYEEKNGWYRIHPKESQWVSSDYVQVDK